MWNHFLLPVWKNDYLDWLLATRRRLCVGSSCRARESLDFEDYPFTQQSWDKPCEICGSRKSFLDEIVTDDQGGRMFVCSDTDYCAKRQRAA